MAATSGNFSSFLDERFGAPPGDRAISPIALRAICAPFSPTGGRKAIESRSLQRALSALKSLARHIARESGANSRCARRDPRAPRPDGACPDP